MQVQQTYVGLFTLDSQQFMDHVDRIVDKIAGQGRMTSRLEPPHVYTNIAYYIGMFVIFVSSVSLNFHNLGKFMPGKL